MHVEWYGQSAFRLASGEATVVVDPFGDLSGLAARGMRFEYPPIRGVEADLVLVTHEHADHNGVEAIAGSPAIIRSTAGRLDSPVGEILAVASEHDDRAGTQRGPNAIYVFALDGVRVAHLGDLGQRELRDEQAEAIGPVDLLVRSSSCRKRSSRRRRSWSAPTAPAPRTSSATSCAPRGSTS